MSQRQLTTYLLDRLAVLASTGSLILGCASLEPVSPLPAGAVEFEAPAAYAVWWESTEACAGLSGHMADVTWYLVPGVSTFPTESGDKVGLWSKSRLGTRIIIAGNYRDHELVVSHEILHELLGREGHPDDYFRQRCHLTWDTFDQQAVAAR